MKKIKYPILICLLAILPIFSQSVFASDLVSLENNKDKPWSILGGYGATHNGMGKTKANVETIDFVVGYEKFLTQTLGQSIFKGRHSLVVEVPLHLVVDPWEDPMIGLNFLARWTFENSNTIKPYIFGGGGPVYTEARIDGLGADLNGNWQFGGGLHFPAFEKHDLILEYRFHHISNLSTRTPNDSLNSSKILVGVKF